MTGDPHRIGLGKGCRLHIQLALSVSTQFSSYSHHALISDISGVLDSPVSATKAEIKHIGETKCQRRMLRLTPSCSCALSCECHQTSCLPRAEKPPPSLRR